MTNKTTGRRHLFGQNYPSGILLLLVYFAYGLVTALVILFQARRVIGTIPLGGAAAVAIQAVVIIITIAVLYGLIKKRPWVKIAAIAWVIVDAAVDGLNYLMFAIDRTAVLDAYRELASAGTVLSETALTSHLAVTAVLHIIIAILITIFLAREKEYFVVPKS